MSAPGIAPAVVIELRVTASPEIAGLVGELLREIKAVRDLLGREIWNALARQERAVAEDQASGAGAASPPAVAPRVAPIPKALGVPAPESGHESVAPADKPVAPEPASAHDAEPGPDAEPKPAPEPPPASAAPAAPCAPPSPTRGWATPERKALLREAWPAGVMIGPLRDRLAALPGPPLPDNSAIASLAATLHLRRPEGWGRVVANAGALRPQRPTKPPEDGVVEVMRSTARRVMVEPRRALPPAAPPATAGLRVNDAPSVAQRMEADALRDAATAHSTLADALLWGARNGVAALRGERPMQTFGRVNNKRRDLRLPAFALVSQRGTMDALPDPSLGAGQGRAA